jgi:hypothetical protein
MEMGGDVPNVGEVGVEEVVWAWGVEQGTRVNCTVSGVTPWGGGKGVGCEVAADTDGGDDGSGRNALLVAGAPLGFPVEAGVDAAGRADPRERRAPARRRSSQRTHGETTWRERLLGFACCDFGGWRTMGSLSWPRTSRAQAWRLVEFFALPLLEQGPRCAPRPNHRLAPLRCLMDRPLTP